VKQHVAIVAVTACTIVAGCGSYSERVVEKPVPAERTVVYTDPAPPPATTTTTRTVYTR
jgi:hypothetical protein